MLYLQEAQSQGGPSGARQESAWGTSTCSTSSPGESQPASHPPSHPILSVESSAWHSCPCLKLLTFAQWFEKLVLLHHSTVWEVESIVKRCRCVVLFSFIGMAYVLQLHSCGTENLYRRCLCEGKGWSLLSYHQEQTFVEESTQVSPEKLKHPEVQGMFSKRVQQSSYKQTLSRTQTELLPVWFGCSLEALNFRIVKWLLRLMHKSASLDISGYNFSIVGGGFKSSTTAFSKRQQGILWIKCFTLSSHFWRQEWVTAVAPE